MSESADLDRDELRSVHAAAITACVALDSLCNLSSEFGLVSTDDWDDLARARDLAGRYERRWKMQIDGEE